MTGHGKTTIMSNRTPMFQRVVDLLLRYSRARKSGAVSLFAKRAHFWHSELPTQLVVLLSIVTTIWMALLLLLWNFLDGLLFIK